MDHVHLVSKDPHAAANWYVEHLGAKIVRSMDMKGAPQIYVSFGSVMVLVRGRRPGESAAPKAGLQWGVDHFGLRVRGDFNALCSDLKQNGVTFSLEPTDINPSTRIAFIDAPDGVSVELLDRKDQP
jgi:catechol 2,3-dioxygenase-like lactoylglutathione lyase family enzyme